MTGSVHAAIGAAIGRFVRNKPLAFALGVTSHFVGDIIPHQDVGAGEAPIVFGTMARIAQQHGWNSPEFWGALGAICPDFEHIPAELRKDPRRFEAMEEKWFPTHNNKVAHAEWPYAKHWGVLMQIVLYVGGLYLAGTLARSNRPND